MISGWVSQQVKSILRPSNSDQKSCLEPKYIERTVPHAYINREEDILHITTSQEQYVCILIRRYWAGEIDDRSIPNGKKVSVSRCVGVTIMGNNIWYPLTRAVVVNWSDKIDWFPSGSSAYLISVDPCYTWQTKRRKVNLSRRQMVIVDICATRLKPLFALIACMALFDMLALFVYINHLYDADLSY